MSFNKKKTLLVLIFAIFLSFLLLNTYNVYLEKKISEDYTPVINDLFRVYPISYGHELQKINAKKDNIFIYCASEFDYYNIEALRYYDGEGTRFRRSKDPREFFPNNLLKDDVLMVSDQGRELPQHIITLGSLSSQLPKKIVYLISMQLYLSDEWELPYFSELNFYDFMKSSKISHDIKKQTCRILSEHKQIKKSFQAPYIYSYLYIQDDCLSKFVLYILKPYFELKRKALVLKDRYDAYKVIRKYKDRNYLPNSNKVDWNREFNEIEEYYRKISSGNQFFFPDKSYSVQEDFLSSEKDGLVHSTPYNSVKMKYLKLFFKLCDELNVRPYIVLQPVNGYFADYAGMRKETREQFYNTIVDIIKEHNFDYYDMREKEYVPYYFHDFTHWSAKAYMDVNKQLVEYFSKEN